MKNVRFISLGLMTLFLLSCGITGINKYNADRSVFANNAILADQNYYARAVMDYYMVNSIISGYGTVTEGDADPNDPLDKPFRGNIQNIEIYTDSVDIECYYKRPEKLSDLESGFQYRYYLFTGEAKASMQAFGITDIDASNETTYLVIDYLQFKDIKCKRLPKIRYAVGLRSELKINYFSSSFDFKGPQSLKNLAAQVELDQAEVFFSLKTIGLTGADARFNIPQGVSFDVTTYKDFQNAIEFVKTKIDDAEDNLGQNKSKSLYVKPEIIPVMDDYRPNLRATIGPIVGEIEGLSKERNRILRYNNRKIDSITKEKMVKLIDNEIGNIIEERTIYDKQYFDLSISVASDLKKLVNKEEKIKSYVRDIRDNESYNTGNTFADFYQSTFELLQQQDATNESAYPNLSQLDGEQIGTIESFYYKSDGVSPEGYVKFLELLESHDIDDDQLNWINTLFDNIFDPINLIPDDNTLLKVGNYQYIKDKNVSLKNNTLFPNLNSLNATLLEQLEVLFFKSEAITNDDFTSFINNLKASSINNINLGVINELVRDQGNTNPKILSDIINTLQQGGNLESLKTR